MTSAQAGILLPPTPLVVYLSFDLAVGSDVGGALARLCTVVDGGRQWQDSVARWRRR